MKRLEYALERSRSPYEADLALLALPRRDTGGAWDRLAAADPARRCAPDLPQFQGLRQAALDAERRQDFATAGTTWKDLQERAERVHGELHYYEQADQSYSQAYDQMLVTVGSMRDLQRRQARTAQHSAALKAADQLWNQAQDLASRDDFREGVDRLQDAIEACRSAVPSPFSFRLGNSRLAPPAAVPQSTVPLTAAALKPRL